MTQIVTPDICDAYPEVAVCDPIFVNYGGQEAFFGPLRQIAPREKMMRLHVMPYSPLR